MATPLDIGLFQSFSSLFPFLFVLVITWAVMMRVEILKVNKAFAAMIAVLFALVTLVSPIAIKTINLMAPWFVLLFLAIVLVMIVYQTFGVTQTTILTVLQGTYAPEFAWVMIVIVGAIIAGSLFTVLSEEKVEFRAGANVTAEQMTPMQWGLQVLTHPKVLGFIAVMLIAMFTIQRLLDEGSGSSGGGSSGGSSGGSK